MASECRVVGISHPRLDGVAKVTGEAKYGADIRLPGLLVGKILRSPHPHARIVSIDTKRARELPGVATVVTAQDTPKVRIGRVVKERYILALDKVRHVGEPVAALAAVDEETAQEALELISVEYELLSGVFDPFEAMKPTAPLVHEDLAGYASNLKLKCKGNILQEIPTVKGDVEAAWAECDIIHEDDYQTQRVHPGFIQTHEATASVDSSGRVTLWSSTKAPFIVRDMVTEALDMPMSDIRVIAATVGGDFGGKGSVIIEPVCVLLAQKSGKPVRIALSWEEEFVGALVRARMSFHLKAGAMKDGTLVALEGRIVADTGAFSDTMIMASGGGSQVIGPYKIPNVNVTTINVYTNNIPTGHVRAPRNPQICFALESHIDMLASKLGLNSVEFRLKNGVEDGEWLTEGKELRNAGLKQTLRSAAEYIRQHGGESGPDRGWGIACGQWNLGTAGEGCLRPSAAHVKINEDGTVVLNTGATESGGGQITVLAQMVAEVLGLTVGKVSVVSADTDSSPHDIATGGSRTTYQVGNTVKLAAEDARRRLLKMAAARWETNPETLELHEGFVRSKEHPETTVPLSALAREALRSPSGPIMGSSTNLREELVASIGEDRDVVEAPHYCTHAVLVEVDRETGQVKVLKYMAAHDVGFAIHPVQVEGQIQGGVVFGLGYALTEEMITREGRVLNPSLIDYHLPNAQSYPKIDMAIIEEPSKYGPFGVKPIGEPPTIPVAAAVANAVYAAVVVRVRELPLTAERVRDALKRMEASSS